jgi:hypothetical protein
MLANLFRREPVGFGRFKNPLPRLLALKHVAFKERIVENSASGPVGDGESSCWRCPKPVGLGIANNDHLEFERR